MHFLAFRLTVLSLVAVSLLIQVSPLYGQSAPREYVANDTAIFAGKVTRLADGGIQFRAAKGSPAVIYTPDDIAEYGIGGDVYEVLSVNGKKKFYKRLVDGEHALFDSDRHYYLRKGDKITLVDKHNFRDVLGEQVPCEGSDSGLKKVRYSSPSLVNYVDQSKRTGCDLDKIAYRKAGIYAGYVLTSFNLEVGATNGLTDQASGAAIGLFLDLPLFRPKSLYTNTEVLVVMSKPSFAEVQQNRTKIMSMDFTAVHVPLGLKWIPNEQKISPYFKGGAVLSYVLMNSPIGLVETTDNGNSIETSREQVGSVSGFQWGFDVGAGVSWHLTQRRNLHFDVRMIRLLPAQFDNVKSGYTGFSFLMGFNF
jgi:hypothetical protein